VFDSSSIPEYYSRLRDFYFEACKKEKDRLIKENERKYINEILEFLKCAK
jgi:hypothetical protein